MRVEAQERPGGWRWLSFALNVVIVMTLYEVYELSRGLIPQDPAIALQHSHAVWDWEVRHGLFVEPAWQQFWLTKDHVFGWLHISPAAVTDFLNTGYLYVHFLGTIAFLIWLYIFRRPIFGFVRNMFFVVTSLALLTYMAYPLAPPRLATNLFYDNRHYTFIDTIQKVLGPVSRANNGQLGYNPYAAMPSLHFAWALIIGGTLLLTVPGWLGRILGICYPAFMLCVIVISGNHFFADAIGSTVIVAFSVVVVMAWTALRRHLRVRRTGQGHGSGAEKDTHNLGEACATPYTE